MFGLDLGRPCADLVPRYATAGYKPGQFNNLSCNLADHRRGPDLPKGLFGFSHRWWIDGKTSVSVDYTPDGIAWRISASDWYEGQEGPSDREIFDFAQHRFGPPAVAYDIFSSQAGRRQRKLNGTPTTRALSDESMALLYWSTAGGGRDATLNPWDAAANCSDWALCSELVTKANARMVGQLRGDVTEMMIEFAYDRVRKINTSRFSYAVNAQVKDALMGTKERPRLPSY